MDEKFDKSGETLPIIEEFYSIQGEGINAGSAAYFIRLAGCDVCCEWCDTKQSWNINNATICNVEEIAQRASKEKSHNVVVTGGEPLMHNLDKLCESLERQCLSVWLETSGTHPLSGNFDWICVSPKSHKEPLDEVLEQANELKIVIKSEEDFKMAEKYAQKVAAECILVLQPEWENHEKVSKLIIEYVKNHPVWKISIQTHKYLGVR
ncbi:MAG: 7-carboxy-7-deazaguanine synthase QueE [Bacteroidales bacterium]|nr:7-carboxy-7-deazaguanine synthase QueE [Bacteroidales bacterium]